MAPDKGPGPQGIAGSYTYTVTAHSTVLRIVVAQLVAGDEKQEEHYEPFIPTAWKLEQNRYDRINAKRKYLSDVARAKRHFGFAKPVKKHSSRKHKR